MKKRLFLALLAAAMLLVPACGKEEEPAPVEIELPPQPDMVYQDMVLNSSAWVDEVPADCVIHNIKEYEAFNEKYYGICLKQQFVDAFPVNDRFFDDHYIISHIERANNSAVSYEIAGIDFDADNSPFIIARQLVSEEKGTDDMSTWFLFRVVTAENVSEPEPDVEITPKPDLTPTPVITEPVVSEEKTPEWVGTLTAPEKFTLIPAPEAAEGEEQQEDTILTYGSAPLSSVYLLYAYYFELMGKYDRFVKDTNDYTADQLIGKLDETILKNTELPELTDEDRDDFTRKILSLSGFAKTKENINDFFTGDWVPDGTDYWNNYVLENNEVYITFGIYYEDLKQRLTAVPINFKKRDYKLFTKINTFELPKDEDGNEIEEIKDRKSSVVYTFYTANELPNHLTVDDFSVSYVGKLENFEITGLECIQGKVDDTVILTVNYLMKESTGKELLQEKDFKIEPVFSEEENHQWP